MWATDGHVYAGGEAGQVYRISPEGQKVETIATTGGFCLGLTLDRDENLYVCDCAKHAVLKVTQDGKVDHFVYSVRGNPLIQPNFAVFDSKGYLYFSDSGDWKRANGVIYRTSLARIIHEHVVILLKPVNTRICDNGVRNPFDTVSFFHESRNYVPDRAKSAFAAIGL